MPTPVKTSFPRTYSNSRPASPKPRAGLASSQKQMLSGARVKQADLILFTTQLSVMLDSGVVLSDAVEAIADQMRPPVFREVTLDLAERLKNGESFSAALSNYPKIFSSMFISMVKASEASGKMAEMLQVLSGYLDADAETRKQVKSAMIYPIVMLLMAVAATGSLMFFVLPRFTRIYEARGTSLPKLTQVLVDFSALLGDPVFLAAASTLLIVGGFALSAWKQTVTGRKTIDWLKVHTPILGGMFVDTVLTRSMRILATMVNTGVNLLDALDVMKCSCGNYYFQCLWESADRKIRDGYQLSDALMLSPYNRLIASSIIQMLRAGEKSGQLGQVCDKISIFLEKKLQNSIRTTTSLIEPLMIVIMGVVIGTLAIALLLPVFRISSVISH